MANPTHAKLLQRLWGHINHRRRIQFGILFLVMLLASFAEVLSLGAVLPFLSALTAPDDIFGHPIMEPFVRLLNLTESKQLLLPLTIIFAICAFLSGIIRLFLLWLQTRLSFAIGADLGVSIYRRTLYQPYSVHLQRNSSEVIAGISTKASSVVRSSVMPLVTLISSVLMLLSIILALLSINPKVAIFGFVGFGAIYMVVILVTKKILIRDSQLINYQTGRLLKALQEGLGGIRDVLIDGTQAIYCNIYRNADLPMRRAQANISIISGSPRFVIEAIGMVLIAALAYSLAVQSSNIASAIPVLGAMVLGAQRMLPLLQAFYANWTVMRGGEASLNDVLDLLDQSLPDYVDSPPEPPISFQNCITLNNLAFRYSNDAPWVLQDEFNLSIKKGSRIGFIGATGSGKSTLLDIIMGLLQPTSGGLEIDGIKITDQNRRGWQAHISHVPQVIFLADTNVAENIAFGVPVEEIDYARVYQAAQKAQIAETIESWGNKFNTLIGERGVRLSGGQRQRIGIARALYKKADVIIFDEATSSLDNETEQSVMEAIDNLEGDLTVIIVAHRLSTLKNCTHIVEIENGRIKRNGTYKEIIGLVA